MPVRIIFRGLILFELPKDGDDKDKLVAHLINKRTIPDRPKKLVRPDKADHKAPRGPHEHRHSGRVQLVTGDNEKDDVVIPVELRDQEDLWISVGGKQGVTAEASFSQYVPVLSEVMRNASIPSVETAASRLGEPNLDLIRNTITVDRGFLRVRNVLTWDHGAFPLSRRGRGVRAAAPVPLWFVGSRWRGHVASEFVVDIPDATSVRLDSNMNQDLTRDAKASGKVNHRVAYDSVEILITNYEVQEHTAVPWGLDFQWLFEAAGYPAADLSGDFGRFEELGRTFDADLYNADRRLLLASTGNPNDPDTYTVGRPFPYIRLSDDTESLTELGRGDDPPAPKGTVFKSADEEDRPICIGGLK